MSGDNQTVSVMIGAVTLEDGRTLAGLRKHVRGHVYLGVKGPGTYCKQAVKALSKSGVCDVEVTFDEVKFRKEMEAEGVPADMMDVYVKGLFIDDTLYLIDRTSCDW